MPAVGSRTRGRAAHRRGAGSPIEVLQPIASEAARELDVFAPTRAPHPSAGQHGKPTAFAIHRDAAQAVAESGRSRSSSSTQTECRLPAHVNPTAAACALVATRCTRSTADRRRQRLAAASHRSCTLRGRHPDRGASLHARATWERTVVALRTRDRDLRTPCLASSARRWEPTRAEGHLISGGHAPRS
jgi:hypothetical protein